MDQEPSASSNGLSKKDRKRLKKIRGRIQQEDVSAERTGLLQKADWLEYQALDGSENLESVGPSIRLRKRNSQAREVVPSLTDNDHHRNILAFLLRELSATTSVEKAVSKKRSRSERDDPLSNPTLPAWATLHNPAAFEKLAVLELHVPNIDEYSSLIESSSVVSKNHSCLSLPTRWFQGDYPKTIGESMLYFHEPGSKNAAQSESNNPSGTWSLDKLVEEMETMRTESVTMVKEGYPQIPAEVFERADHKKMDEKRHSELPDPSTIPLHEAAALVKAHGFRVDDQAQDDSQLYVATLECGHDVDENLTPRVLGVDCEMVQTALGAELARITIVQLQGVEARSRSVQTETILDALVKPKNEILDYVTTHSGITPKLLENISTTLEQVQAALLSFLRPSDILIGHSLENDLRATRFIHSKIIDTAILFRPRNRRCKFSLRHLVKVLLRRTIQDGSHCSEQDAVATLELAVRRALEGDSFGIAGQNRKSILDAIPRDCTGVCLGPSTWLQSHVTNHANGIHALAFESISESRKAILSYLGGRRKSVFIYSRPGLDEGTESRLADEVLKFLVSHYLSFMVNQFLLRPPVPYRVGC